MSQATPSAIQPAETSDPATSTPAQTLDDRYNTGRKRRLDRRIAWGAAGLLVAAGAGFLLFSGWETANQVTAQDIGYVQTDDFTLDVKFEVTGPPQTPVACAIEALNTSKATVGWSVVELPVTDARNYTVTAPLHITTPATAATVRTCWVVK